MTDSDRLDDRVNALREQGWTLVSAPSVSDEHDRARLTAPLVMERTWNGRQIREGAHDLATLLEMAEWQERRLQSIDRSPLEVHTGLANTDTY